VRHAGCMGYPQRMKWDAAPVTAFANDGSLLLAFSNFTMYPHPSVDELCITYAVTKFTGKQLIHIIHRPLWITCV
jgi:hypothetical protein